MSSKKRSALNLVSLPILAMRPSKSRRDLAGIEALFLSQLKQAPRMDAIRAMHRLGRVTVASQENKILGFAYGVPFAPDIMELQHIYLHPEWRNHEYGRRLLGAWEIQVAPQPQWRGIVLVNSDEYRPGDMDTRRRPDHFYERNGYHIAADTGATRVWYKALPRLTPAGLTEPIHAE